MLIRKVWKTTSTEQLMVTIPKENEQGIKEGDYVELVKVKKQKGKK